MALKQRQAQPTTPLTDPDGFTIEEIVDFMSEEYGIDLSDKSDHLVLGYLALAQKGEDVVGTYESSQRLVARYKNRTPQEEVSDALAPMEAEKNLEQVESRFEFKRLH